MASPVKPNTTLYILVARRTTDDTLALSTMLNELVPLKVNAADLALTPREPLESPRDRRYRKSSGHYDEESDDSPYYEEYPYMYTRSRARSSSKEVMTSN